MVFFYSARLNQLENMGIIFLIRTNGYVFQCHAKSFSSESVVASLLGGYVQIIFDALFDG